jgi:hypothetical protein
VLAELSTKEISEVVQPKTLDDHEDVAKQLRALAQNPSKKAGTKT